MTATVPADTDTILRIAGVVRSSAVDGPGNRYVLFLQGCNLDCIACHNPSTIPRDAIEGVDDRTVVDVVDEIETVAPFIRGITVSGGEPTLQLDGLVALLGEVKRRLPELTTLVDSNGTLGRRGWERLFPVLDGAMIDLKAASEELHRALTGHGNEHIKATIRFLHEHGKLAELRLLVIEGVTDTPEELEAWAGFVRGVDHAIPVRLMAFRHAGTRPAARRWPETSPEAVDAVRRRLAELGLSTVG